MAYDLVRRMQLWKEWKDYLGYLFQKSQQEDRDIQVQEQDYIKITKFEEVEGGCRPCDMTYQTFYLTGIIYTENKDDEDYLKKIEFSANIDGCHFNCNHGSDDYEPEPLFKAYLEHTHPIYHYFLDKETLKLKE